MIHRAFQYRLYPTPEQAEQLAQFVGTTRFVYNLALEQRETFWRQYHATTGSRLNFVSQGRQVTELRRDVDWIASVPYGALTQALRDLDRSYAAFFAGRSRYPTPRRKGIHDSFRLKAIESGFRAINRRWAMLRIQNLGWIKLRLTQPIRGRWMSVTVSKRADQWLASLACEIEHEAEPSALPAVGIDRGIANTLALSTGDLLSTPATEHLERRRKRAQRVLARRKRGSARYRKQRLRVSRLSAKIARVRADWRHKITTDIAGRFGAVVIEDLKTASMTRSGKGKRVLNKSIMAQGWGIFEQVLSYKLEERGGTLVKVSPHYTSQECSACGTVDSRSRKNQASFVCTNCGAADHADTNAAKVILRRSTASMRAEGRGYPPGETRTINHALAA